MIGAVGASTQFSVGGDIGLFGIAQDRADDPAQQLLGLGRSGLQLVHWQVGVDAVQPCGVRGERRPVSLSAGVGYPRGEHVEGPGLLENDGSVSEGPLGDKAAGLLIYHEDGYMAASLLRTEGPWPRRTPRRRQPIWVRRTTTWVFGALAPAGRCGRARRRHRLPRTGGEHRAGPGSHAGRGPPESAATSRRPARVRRHGLAARLIPEPRPDLGSAAVVR